VYGSTNLEGEQAVVESGCPHVILRTTWVYDTRGKNFLRSVLRLGREREELRMVADQFGAPTWARTIAEATASIVTQILTRKHSAAPNGIFHLTAAGQTSWAEFAQSIVEEYEDCCSWAAETSEFGAPLKVKRIVPITSDQYQTPARRPHNSVLSNTKIEDAYGITMPAWRDQLRLAMQDAIR
jgi:dTDP-4-dehydrorhamnose reductase